MNRTTKLATAALMSSTMLSPIVAGIASASADEILVTATRRAASVIDVPYNITAIGGDALESANVSDLTDLIKFAPGVAYLDQGPRFSMNNYIILRGLNANSSSGASDLPQNAQAPVSMYVGEVPIFTNIRLNDIERVEVLRGPQGTLYVI